MSWTRDRLSRGRPKRLHTILYRALCAHDRLKEEGIYPAVATQRERRARREMPTITGAHHVAFTVQDLDTSSAWYADLFGMRPPLQSDDENVRIRVLAHPDSGLIIRLREYADHDDGVFSEFRTGLDHIAFRGVVT